MSEKARFHEMTKPMKFRRLKMVKQFTADWCVAQRERIKYLFNYLLYKLKILNRYSYRDNVERVVTSPHILEEEKIQTEYFGGTVNMKLISVLDIDVDYFYYKKKDGSIKITMTLKDSKEETLFTVSHLENIHIKVGDQWHDVNHLPVFKMASIVKPKPVEFVDASFIEKPIEPRVVEYDIFKLKTYYHKLLVGKMSPTDITEAMYKFYYECSRKELLKVFSRLTLMDIMK